MSIDRTVTGDETSRRGFFEAALAGGAAVVAAGASVESQPLESDPQDQLEDFLTRHGSELGDLRRVR